MAQLLTVGRLARAAQVSTDTIRYYDAVGLLPPATRSPAGYRLYPPTAVERLQLIRRAQSLGLALAEIRELLKQEDVAGFGATLEQELLLRIPAYLAEAEQRVAQLQALRDELAARQSRGARTESGTASEAEAVPPAQPP